MNKIIKRLFTPLAVFAMAIGIGVSVNAQKDVVGARAEVLTDSLSAKGWGGYTTASFGAVGVDYSGTASTSGATIAMQIFNGSTGAVRGNQSSMTGNFSMRNTTEYPGYIRKITLIVTGGTVTTSTSRSVLSLGATPFASNYVTTTGSLSADNISTGLYTVTWTVPAGQDFKYFKLHSLQTSGTALAAANNAIQIEYESVSQSFGTLDRIELSGGKRDYVVGETFTTEGLLVTAFDETNYSKTVTSYTTNKTGYTFLTSDIGTVTVTVSYTEGSTKTATFDVTVIAIREFSKITSTSDLYFGAEYLIVSEGTTASVMTTTYTSFFGRSDVTINSNTIVAQDLYQILKLVISPSTGSFGFQFVNGPEAGKYLSLNSDANNLNSSTTLTSESSWLVTFDTGNVIVNSVAFTNRNVKYNSGSPRFATYTSAQTPIQLFLNQDSVDHTTSANMLATEINTGLGSKASSTVDETCISIYAMLDSVYTRLSATAKNIFDTSSDSAFVSARARMAYLAAWVAANTPSGRSKSPVTSNSTVTATFIIGIIGISSLLGYYFVTKRTKFQ